MSPQRPTVDITELLFHGDFAQEAESQPEIDFEVYSRASEEATKLVGTSSPMELLRKTEELYAGYMASNVTQ